VLAAGQIADNTVPDCELTYLSNFLSNDDATALYELLISRYDITNADIPMADGSTYVGPNGQFLFADAELLDQFEPAWGGRAAWPDALDRARQRSEEVAGVPFRACRSIFYRDGSHFVAFHADPTAYGPTDTIASLSLGATRVFTLRRNDSHAIYEIALTHGSLLILGRGTQTYYEHALLPDPEVTEPRINLTFRMVDTG